MRVGEAGEGLGLLDGLKTTQTMDLFDPPVGLQPD